MNQIIYLKNASSKLIEKYKILFYVSIITLLSFIIYYGIAYFSIHKKEQISNKILSNYDIQKLYSSYTTIDSNIILESGKSADIIGIIEIEKINLRYPILANFSDELLKIAPCKFYGDSLDKIGNICIVGHNYNNGEFFSNLYLLELGDTINIFSITGLQTSYTIYEKFETSPHDLSCLNQDTIYKEITLITCSNSNKNRLIIKAKNR